MLANRLGALYTLDLDHRLVPHSRPDINSDGIRSRREAGDIDPTAFNIIVLGDSFTYGYGVELEQSYPALVEQRLTTATRPVTVTNFGWTSSSPLLAERLLADIGADYAPDLVVLGLDLTDFHDDPKYHLSETIDRISPTEYLLRSTGLHWLLGDVDQLFSPPGWWPWSRPRPELPRSFFIVNQPLEDGREVLAILEDSLQRLARRCRVDLGAEFVLVLLPRHFQFSDRECPENWEAHHYRTLGPWVHEPNKWLCDLASRVDFACYDLLTDFATAHTVPLCFEDDPHWTPAGHQVAAEAIADRLVAGGHLPSARPSNRSESALPSW